MLGIGNIYAKSANNQRRRIDSPLVEETKETKETKETDKTNILTKEEKRKNQMTTLANKYFNKIVNAVIKANSLNKKSIKFYYNYYDFTNDRLGKPHGFLNEFMYEMCYDNSLYINKDESGIPITFKTLFGHKFSWELVGKNMMIISW